MIAFYVSSHGFGHMSRSLALIEQILKNAHTRIYLVSGNKQIEFARHYLENYLHRIEFNVQVTDVGLINHNQSLTVDIESLEEALKDYTHNLDVVVAKEVTYLRDKEIQMVVTDISVLGIYVAKSLNVPVIGVSNFTWYDQYKFLGIDKELCDFFYSAYQQLDYYYAYALSLDNNYLNCPVEEVGFVTRAFNAKKVKHLQKHNPMSIYISCGQSAELEVVNLDIANISESKKVTVFYTEGLQINTDALAMPLNRKMNDTHNYIAASTIAVIKSGWSSVAEAIVGKTPMVVIKRDGVLEDSHIIKKLIEKNLAFCISEDEIKNIDFNELYNRSKSLSTLDVQNEAAILSQKLLSHLDVSERTFALESARQLLGEV